MDTPASESRPGDKDRLTRLLRRQLANTRWLILVSLVSLLAAVVLVQLWVTGEEFPVHAGLLLGR